MKKLSILLFVILAVTFASAQRYGARIGGNFSGMMATVKSEGTKIAPGMNVGLLTELGGKKVNLHIEANYAQKGFNINLDESVDGQLMQVQQQVNFEYLEVPVLLKVNPPVIPLLYFYAGPYFGLALKGELATELYKVDGTVQDIPSSVNIFKDNLYQPPYKRSDFGITFGVGAQFGIGNLAAFVEGRAALGLSNLYDTEDAAYQDFIVNEGYKDTDHIKNMVFSLGAGIIIGED